MTRANEATTWVVAAYAGLGSGLIVVAHDRMSLLAVAAILAIVGVAFGACTLLWREQPGADAS